MLLIDERGEEIEADLFTRGWDLLDYMRGERPWSQLLRLLRRLPMWSHYQAALLMDPELGELRARQDDSEAVEPQPLSPLHYDLPALLALRHIDVTKELIRVVASVFAERPAAPLPPEPRPMTAEAQARARADRDQVLDVLARLGVQT
ncbi:hypothetical protein [Nocardia lijiangensis]|uniref:hypothetical protein n=1 Tax=Nocardia lijiangensis TaxID=299618 RepID=UPI00083261BF|nr:hypothetical protein [Nocardia lijiangensis]